MSEHLRNARFALEEAYKVSQKISSPDDRVGRLLEISRQYQDLAQVESYVQPKAEPAPPEAAAPRPEGEAADASNQPGDSVSQSSLRWDGAYRDANGKHGTHWRLVATQNDTDEVLMRDWYPSIEAYGEMIYTWDRLVEDYGPITLDHEL